MLGRTHSAMSSIQRYVNASTPIEDIQKLEQQNTSLATPQRRYYAIRSVVTKFAQVNRFGYHPTPLSNYYVCYGIASLANYIAISTNCTQYNLETSGQLLIVVYSDQAQSEGAIWLPSINSPFQQSFASVLALYAMTMRIDYASQQYYPSNRNGIQRYVRILGRRNSVAHVTRGVEAQAVSIRRVLISKMGAKSCTGKQTQ